MAKLTGSAKKAFLARMARGKKAKGRGKRRNPGATMPSALIVNPSPRKRRRRKNAKRRTHARRKRTTRRNILLPVANPRRRRRRRNPGMGGGAIKELAGLALPGAVAGAAIGFLDSKVAGRSAVITYGAKVGVALAGLTIGKKLPMGLGRALASAAFATLGYSFGVKMAGGIVAPNPVAGAADVKKALEDDSTGQMAALLDAELRGIGMGLIVDENPGMGEGEGYGYEDSEALAADED